MKVLIRKFKTIENLEIAIPTQISGGNGAGKSTILEAVSFVLTGKNLDGNEFKQVYDNREDLHDAKADVSFLDNYGNEFQRIVKPIFQTNRAGVEEIKIKRSTECRKNGIPCNDFTADFSEFYKFGTDFFFRQKEDVQRGIFIDLLKSKMPTFDAKEQSAKLKELKKAQKLELDAIKNAQDFLKAAKNVVVPEISKDLEEKNTEFISLSMTHDATKAEEVNKANNEAIKAHYEQKNALLREISTTQNNIAKIEGEIDIKTKELDSLKNANFEPKTPQTTEQLEEDVKKLTDELSALTFYNDLKEYADANLDNNPILVENREKLNAIFLEKFNPLESDLTDKCPLSGVFCETAKEKSLEGARIKFDSEFNAKVSAIKNANRSILTKEMNEANDLYFSAKRRLTNAANELSLIVEGNAKLEAQNDANRKKFFELNAKSYTAVKNVLMQLQGDLAAHCGNLVLLNSKLSNLAEPTLQMLPESVVISDELQAFRDEYLRIEKEIIGAKAINANNAKIKGEKESEIKEKQNNLLKIIEEITILQAAISDYFANLKGIISEEFKGEISIDVELLEYVMANDDYKDCFKITANGKVFPYECNGALQNNTKLQILANMQRLTGYTGVTLMDNCEANTSQPLNTLNLNCVTAFATNKSQLTIK